jgi:hypothetical protein
MVLYAILTVPRVHFLGGRSIKGWRREKKVALIESVNSGWKDLSEGWFE